MLLAAVLGLVFGFVGSIPVAGPIAALVVTRALEGRYRSGVWIAVGGGLVEAAYALLAFWGFSTYLARYPLITPISRAGGAAVLLILGVMFWRRTGRPVDPSEALPAPRDSAVGSLALGAWICAINPTLIATWTAVVTTVHGSGLLVTEARMAIPFAVGCGLGITAWFGLLLGLMRRHRDRFDGASLPRVMRAVAVLLVAGGLWFAWRFAAYLA